MTPPAPVPAPAWRTLRLQLALVGFLAIYLPVLVLFGVTRVTEDETIETRDGVEVTAEASTDRSAWTTWTAVALGPVAGALAWWLAGRAVRPINRVRAVADNIQGSDLSRRIGLERGPAELVALAASFDAMLDRLERAADTQRRLVEEASHELRTPLAVLATNADVLLADPSAGVESYRRGLERSRAAAARLRTTIDDLLVDARGRARTLDRRPADLVAIARAAVDDARVLAERRQVTLALAGPPSARCAVDQPTVRRAVANLLDNAVRYAPDGTTVDVEVAVTAAVAAVSVTDHGPGIPPDQQERIFERFWRGGAGTPGTADAAGTSGSPDAPGTPGATGTPGTGLGLPIARQIALAHGGDLTVRSPGPAGDGATFTLSLRCGADPDAE